MAEIDTSSYPTKAGPNKILGGIGEAAEVANAIQNNRLLKLKEQQGGLDLQKSGQDLAAGQATSVYSAYGSLLNGDKPVDHSRAAGLVTDWMRQGRISPGVGKTLMNELPTDKKALREFLIGRYTSTLPPEVSTSPTQTGVTGAGQPVYGTRGQFIGGATAGAEGPQGGVSVPAAASGAPAQRSAQAGIVTSLPPGQVEAAAKVGEASGALLAGDLQSAANYRANAAPLETAIPLLETLGPTGTGPGKDQVNFLRNIAVSWGIAGADTAKDAELFDKAKKYLIQEARASGDVGTNDKLAASFAGNPNTTMSNAAAIDVAKVALTLKRLKAAQPMAFQESGLPASDYSKWAAKWAANLDKRAFGWDLMNAEQRKKTWESIPKDKRAGFKSSVNDAAKYGLIATPESPNGP